MAPMKAAASALKAREPAARSTSTSADDILAPKKGTRPGTRAKRGASTTPASKAAVSEDPAEVNPSIENPDEVAPLQAQAKGQAAARRTRASRQAPKVVNCDTMMPETPAGQSNPSTPVILAPVDKAKRTRRTKAQIEADKQADLDEKSRVKQLETTLKSKLDKKVVSVEERDRALVVQRQAELISRRPEAVTLPTRPLEEDDLFSAGQGARSLPSLFTQTVFEFDEELEENFEEELQKLSLEGDLDSDDSESGDEEIKRIQEALDEAKKKKEAAKLARKKVPEVAKPSKDNTRMVATGLRNEYRFDIVNKASTPIISFNPIGGIADEDVEDERPSETPAVGRSLGRGVARKNTLVAVSPALPSQGPSAHPSSNARAMKTTKKRVPSPLPAMTPSSTPFTGVLGAPTPTPTLLHHQWSSGSLASTAQSQAIRPSSSKSRHSPTSPCPEPGVIQGERVRQLTAHTVRKPDLPPFTQVERRWATTFLPTLYDQFHRSREPFKDWFVSTPRLVTIIQGVVDEIYPDFDYNVQLYGDPVLLVSYNRINERRTGLADYALTLVSDHVKAISDLTAANEWLSWACRLTGPLYFDQPTPYYCKAKIGDPGFIPPTGKMRSKFVTAMAKQALKLSANASTARPAFQAPIGLYGLIIAALGRAAETVRADGSIPETKAEFSYDRFGERVADAISSLEGISEEKWIEILACSTTVRLNQNAVNVPVHPSVAHIERRQMFTFESPFKRR
ncbi:hypothetical protein DFP72DRAFT_1122970 [Ephemerocybe angulata]|uniref:Uncharacterized protein n=1 Tax=Ephemerocybe angulata TaxID=980116 RepID=A0A8H6HY38_9AGAR|nr:hypothetical protein DFP72DRAFT_1122970 [Tulosesus angulatus]